MLRHIKITLITELAVIIGIMVWTYCYPCPPEFDESAQPPFSGPQWYREWRYNFDGQRFINSMVWNYHDPKLNQALKPKMLRLSEPLIESGFWLLFARSCVDNGLILAILSPLLALFPAKRPSQFKCGYYAGLSQQIRLSSFL